MIVQFFDSAKKRFQGWKHPVEEYKSSRVIVDIFGTVWNAKENCETNVFRKFVRRNFVSNCFVVAFRVFVPMENIFEVEIVERGVNLNRYRVLQNRG